MIIVLTVCDHLPQWKTRKRRDSENRLTVETGVPIGSCPLYVEVTDFLPEYSGGYIS